MKQLDPKSVWLFFFTYLFRWLLPIAIMAFYLAFISWSKRAALPESFSLPGWFWLIPVLFIAACYAWARLAYFYYRYELTETGFRKESGVIYKRYATIPYDRIQNVDIYRGLLSRMLGLSDLQIQTAGYSAVAAQRGFSGAGAEGRLPGLPHKVAEVLRDELIARTCRSTRQGL